ncbi:hypothetical protein [Lutimonas sp.]|uniref:hypothetical protein n=1 Tax=Lutimonas sp. TaxID=1872403 RepID=UPI003C70DA59
MKTDFKHLNRIFVLVVLLIGYYSNVYAQEFKLSDYKMRFTFTTQKDTANNRQLDVSFLAANKKDRKDRIPVTEALIKFYHSGKDTLLLIGESKTNKQGIASMTVPESMPLEMDEEGYFNFIAQFDKTESLKRQKKSIQVKDLILDLNLTEQDSTQIVTLNAFTKDSLGNQISVEELDVVFSVGGMLSRLPLEEASVEDGVYEFEMPSDIPGDLNGDFQLYAFVDDHDDFGTVLQSVKSNWGVFDDIVKPEKNKLWTEAAPIWMYVVLTFLLVGVWANYLYTIIKLWKIKKIGSNV